MSESMRTRDLPLRRSEHGSADAARRGSRGSRRHGSAPAATAGDDLDLTRIRTQRSARAGTLFTALVLALIAACILSAAIGQLFIPPQEVVGSVLNKVGIDWLPGPSHEFGEEALWQVRFPRVVMTVLVGAALAVAGAMMQGVFGNPLAEPGVVGVSAGAAVGASASILFGWTFLGGFTTPAIAFASGLITTFIVYTVSRSGGRTEVITLVLTGVAVNAIAGAGIAYITFAAPTSAREQIVFWQLGSFNGSLWSQVGLILPLIVVGILISQTLAPGLDILSLGERSARHVGINVERLRLIVMAVVALLVSAAVAFCGIIAFVGLVVPHIIRMIIGPGHRLLLPASVLGGAVLLSIADLAARTLVEFADLPIGMLTSLVGGPFFFYLIRRSRRESGGWM